MGQPPPSPLVFRLARAILIAIFAYFVAAIVYILLDHASRSVVGQDVANPLQGTVLFILLVIVLVGCIVPLFNPSTDAGVRTFSFFCAAFIVAFAVFHDSTTVDVGYPLKLLSRYVFDPFRRSIRS